MSHEYNPDTDTSTNPTDAYGNEVPDDVLEKWGQNQPDNETDDRTTMQDKREDDTPSTKNMTEDTDTSTTLTEDHIIVGETHHKKQNSERIDGDAMAREALENVGDLIDNDRDTHGDAIENQEHIAEAWEWYLDGQGKLLADAEITPLDVCYMMMLLKMSRNAVGEFDPDHPLDVAGYAGIGAASTVVTGRAEPEDLDPASE
jgi:hypothetical protein